MNDPKTAPDSRKHRPLADNDPRKARLEAIAGMIKANPMPGKLFPEDTKGVIDASFEALAVDYGASLYTCFLCGTDVVEFATWRALCEVDACNMEFIRCRKCDPDGAVTKDVYHSHIEAVHPDEFEPCPGCGVVCLRPRMRTMGCSACGAEIVRCRARCDAVAVYEEHVRTEHVAVKK